MKRRYLIISLLLASFFMDTYTQNQSAILNQEEINSMNAAIRADSMLSKELGSYGNPVELYKQYKINLIKSDSIWNHDQRSLEKMKNIGVTKHFEMIPLIEWFTDCDNLIGESGVSYLIKTDDATILFDLGANEKHENPSPLEKNMKRLGIKMEDIDIVVISHNHGDHTGGSKFQPSLKQMPVYAPAGLKYPGINTINSSLPTKIARGVATIGSIHNPIFFGDIEEQALAINVENKGIVIISGCGHQSIDKILQRTRLLFEEPIYGVLGGFHFPMEECRNITWDYKYYVVGKLPWEPLAIEDVERNCELLKAANVKWVGLSAHDSSDKSISIFKQSFPDSYVDIKVGKKISLNGE